MFIRNPTLVFLLLLAIFATFGSADDEIKCLAVYENIPFVFPGYRCVSMLSWHKNCTFNWEITTSSKKSTLHMQATLTKVKLSENKEMYRYTARDNVTEVCRIMSPKRFGIQGTFQQYKAILKDCGVDDKCRTEMEGIGQGWFTSGQIYDDKEIKELIKAEDAKDAEIVQYNGKIDEMVKEFEESDRIQPSTTQTTDKPLNGNPTRMSRTSGKLTSSASSTVPPNIDIDFVDRDNRPIEQPIDDDGCGTQSLLVIFVMMFAYFAL